jgi:hypothetical protein
MPETARERAAMTEEGRPSEAVQSTVWSPAQLISWENLEPRPNTDIGCSQNFDFLLMESHHFMKIIFECTLKN